MQARTPAGATLCTIAVSALLIGAAPTAKAAGGVTTPPQSRDFGLWVSVTAEHIAHTAEAGAYKGRICIPMSPVAA